MPDESTLAIVLGAGEFPRSKKLHSNPAFRASARAFLGYLASPRGLGLAPDKLLNLFDSETSAADQVLAIAEFLAANKQATDLLIYYVGHGGFLKNRDYFLAIRCTSDGREFATTLEIEKVAFAVQEHFRKKRVRLVLDCCFAGEAVRFFQGGELELAQTKASQAFPASGTALLVASSKHDVAMAPESQLYTKFSGALLAVLTHGIAGGGERLSLAEVGEQVIDLLARSEGNLAARPEVHSPQQTQGDVARVPLFPNPAAHAPDAAAPRTAAPAAAWPVTPQEAPLPPAASPVPPAPPLQTPPPAAPHVSAYRPAPKAQPALHPGPPGTERAQARAIKTRDLKEALTQQIHAHVARAEPARRSEMEIFAQRFLSQLDGIKPDALSTEPWYVVLGPPRSGKSTAIRQYGGGFPEHAPSTGPAGCGWWFSSDAIFLENGGNLDGEAHGDWIDLLDQALRAHRAEHPINGVIVTLDLPRVLDATGETIVQIGRDTRAWIDEMQVTLRMVLPVYVLFTKCDLITGFSEYFGDLGKEKRSQAWGATVRLDADKSDPRKTFEAEFDTLMEQLHNRGLRRLATEQNREVSAKVYQFPLEFGAAKHPLAHFISALLSPSSGAARPALHSGTCPIFRGFYFMSATQDGKPLGRLGDAMRRASGLGGNRCDEPAPQAAESKNYFVRGVFTKVIFPDRHIAKSTLAGRQRLKRLASSAAAVVLALLLLIPAWISYRNNMALMAKTDTICGAAAKINWSQPEDALRELDTLDELRAHAELLEIWNDSTPISHGWFMYQGEKLFDVVVRQYILILKKGFVQRVNDHIEDELRKATSRTYVENYRNLKTYLLLDDKNRLHLEDDSQWQADRLTQLCADMLRSHVSISEADLKYKLAPHIAFYVNLIRRGVTAGEPNQRVLVESVRDILARVGVTQRYYDEFVMSLINDKFDENGPDTPENVKYPPVTLAGVFHDRVDVLDYVLKSQHEERTGKWLQVDGPYTSTGRLQVLASLQEGRKILGREQWVVPLSSNEKEQGFKIQTALNRVREDYYREYMSQWMNFFLDIRAVQPLNNREALVELRTLCTPDWPYVRLLRALDDATQLPKPESQDAAAAVQSDGGIVDQIKEKTQKQIEAKTQGKMSRLNPFLDEEERKKWSAQIAERFRPIVRFGISPPLDAGMPPPGPPALHQYIDSLKRLVGELEFAKQRSPFMDTPQAQAAFEATFKETHGLLLTMEETGQELMTPLLINPLTIKKSR